MSSKGREVDNLPLTVNLASGINRKGIYFITTDEIDKFAAPVAPVIRAVITPAPVAKGSTRQSVGDNQLYVYDGSNDRACIGGVLGRHHQLFENDGARCG